MSRGPFKCLQSVGLLASVLATGLLAGNGKKLQAQNERSKLIHRLAPDFVRMGISRREPLELKSYRGKVVLLNFWATWCEPCVAEMPTFNEWQKKFGDKNFQMIGISMDDAPAAVRATVSKLKVTYPVAMGDEHLAAAYGGVLGVPVTFLIDRRGRVQARYESVGLSMIKQDIERLLSSH